MATPKTALGDYGVLGCSAARVSSRIRSQQSSAPRVLLDGRKSAKSDASLELIWGISDNECRARHGDHSLDLPVSGERLSPRRFLAFRLRNSAWRPALCHRERTVRVRSFSARLYLHGCLPAFTHLTPLTLSALSLWFRSHYCSEHGPHACGHCHSQRTPERHAYCAHRHIRPARARSQCTQKCEEHQ
jgi:hypothetical protein